MIWSQTDTKEEFEDWWSHTSNIIISQKWNFLLRRENVFLFQDIQVFVFLTIPWLTKSVTLWWVSVHETGCIFEYFFEPQPQHFWTTTHSVTKFGQLIDISKSNNFQEQTGATFLVIFYSVTFSNYSITNYVKIPMFHFFEKVNKGQLKMVNIKYKKWLDLAILLL